MKQPNAIDWAIYKMFRWWWNPIFKSNPLYALGVAAETIQRLGATIKYDKEIDEMVCEFNGAPNNPMQATGLPPSGVDVQSVSGDSSGEAGNTNPPRA